MVLKINICTMGDAWLFLGRIDDEIYLIFEGDYFFVFINKLFIY